MLEDSGGGAPDGRTAAGPRRPRAVSTDDKTAATALLAMAWAVLLVTGVAEAVLSTATFKGEQQSDIGVQIGQSAMLPCELDDRGRHQCGSVHSVKWYRGASRIFLYSSAVPVTQPRKGYQDRTSWSYTPNDTVAYLVLENITAQDESIYKCEITYTAVHEGCNIVQFINLTTHIDPDYIGVGVLPADDGNNNNEVGGASDAGDSEYDETQKRTVKMNSGSVVGPLDEDGNVRLYCESGRAKPVPQVTWWWNGSQLSSGTDYRFKRLPGGLSVARNVLTLSPLKRGSGGRYECRVKTAANASPVLTSFLELTVNVRPLSVQIISNAGDDDDDDDDDSHTVAATVSGTSDPSDSEPAAASAVEGRGLVLKCVARGARPQANVTWYYYQKDDAGESGGGGDNDEDDAKKNAVDRDDSSSKSNHQHKQPVVLSSGRPGELTTTGSTTTPPAPAIGSVEIAQHTEYQADGTRDTHSQLEMSSLNRRQDGSILRCDAYNSVGQNKEGSTTRPLSVNMTIRVKYAPTVWLARPKIIVINESQSVNVQCEYSANPMNPALVKWYRNGVEIAVEDYGGGNRKAAGSSANNILLSSTSTKYFRVNETGLRIDRAHRSASGEYSCSVRNAVGQTNSTDVVKLLVQYTPRVRLELVIDGEGNDDEKSSVPSHRPAVLESEQLNVTLRCAVVSEDGGAEADSDGMKSDGTYDPSLNLTVVHWYWNGVQMQLPNCSRPDGYDDDFEDEDENNGATNNYFYSPGIVGPGDFDEETMLIMRNQHADENGTSKRRTMRVVCSDRELVLMNVSKNMHGNYSCRARNAAGLLTPMSEQTPLVVYFAPGPVTLEFSPRRVIKGRNVTLRCNAQYLGRPQHPTNYSWYRDGHQVIMNNHNHNQNNSAEWFVEHVSLETRANFTCSAFNAGGVTKSEPVYIEVLAPPNYISRAPQYKGVAYNDTHVNASCTVECYPLCSVEWLRQNVPIDPINNPQDKQRYSIVTEYLPAERLKNDFEAVRSTLVWRLENWTNGMGRPGLDPATDSTTYSCRSSSNNVGVGVPESTMHFSVEYPPTNMSVSKTVVHVNEGNIPEKVFCNADAHPGPTFEWYRQNSESSSSSSSAAALATNSSQQPSGQLQTATQQQPFSQMERKSTANWLMFNTAVFPKHAGNYICVAHNAHGDGVIQTYLDVMYKPSCTLNLMKVSDPEATPIVNSLLKDNPSRPDDGGAAAYDLDDPERRILVCTVKANPGQVQFTWTTVRRENQNDTDSPAAVSYPVTEETVVTWGESVVPTDVEGFTAYSPNRSVLILKESVAMSEENGIDGVRTYVCTISNAVGTEQCTVKVQGDTPWWKQLLVAVGLGGLGIQSGWIVVVVLVILAVIIIAVLSLLIFLLCRKFMQPDGTQKYVKQKFTTSFSSSQISAWRSRSLLFFNDHRSSLTANKKYQGRQTPEGSASTTNGSAGPNGFDNGGGGGSGEDQKSPTDRMSVPVASESPASAVGKWPLKPGVLVHVKQQRRQCEGSFTSTTENSPSKVAGGGHRNTDARQEKTSNDPAAIVVLLDEPAPNESQSARTDRIRRMNMTNANGKSSSSVSNLTKRRSAVPALPPPPPPRFSIQPPVIDGNESPPSIKPKSIQKDWRGNRHNLGTGRSGQPLDGGSNGGIDSKAFYENLPFHGMRPPPNQLPARNIDQFSYQLQQLQLQYQHDRQQPPQLCRNDRANETTNQYATPVAPTAQQYNSTTISRTALQPNHHHQSMEMTQMADRRSEQLREPQRWPAYGQRRPQQREDDGGATLDSYYHRGSVQQPNAGGGGSMDGSLQKDPSTGNSTKRRRQGHAGGMYGRTNTIGGGDTAAPDTESQRRRRNVWADSAGAEHTSFTNSHYYGRRRTNAINDNGGNYNTLGGRTVSVNGYDTGGRQKRSQPKRTLSSSYYCPGGSSTWKAGTAGGDRQDDDDDGRPGTRPDAPEVAVVGCGGVTSADGTANREDTPAGTVKFHRDVGREIDV
ncbi:uncharacterized protein LOC126898699 isoform X2 [Daktulosphaira vitifoliae]|uniref:uncharacterized protein LOC126898699 isoform X2 n=1 Tax=Daktulosphaira vitifoliae TaxID=58002 RepID=UPI0021AAD3AB|nr:uncharacterized protein LOC126898699 isoform X2 [Daktulosphaira vitifoliae]